MEGSSATSSLGEPTVPIIASCVPSLSAAESVNSAQNQVFSDATSFGEINSPMLLIDDSSTPKKKQSFSQEGSLYKPQCHEEFKPKVGMIFDDIGSVLKFYRTYAHSVGFGVRLGQQKLINSVLQWKRILCGKEGFRPEKGMDVVDSSKKRRNVKLTRCGCEAFIYVTRESDGKYKVASINEYHNHPFVPPSQQHLVRSNRQVSERVKSTLHDCQKASIGTALAYRFLHVGAGGFDHVGCTQKDLQNHYGVLKNKIKNCDAQMLVDQLGRFKALNPSFFFEYEVDEVPFVLDRCDNTNQYEYTFAPFTGLNHHMQSVFFGAGFLLHETKESFVWLFKAFLKAMGGIAPRVIITDECSRMRNAIAEILPNNKHRLCMWHIMEKFPGKRQNELIADNTSGYTTSELLTSWEVEKQGREVFTHEIFELFQAQVLAARDDCDVQNTTNGEGIKVMSVSDQYNKIREVCYDTTNMVAKCSCKLFESKGIVCRHIIRVPRGAKINELPSHYVLKRWNKNCKRDIMFEGEGNVLEENFIDLVDMAVRRKISAIRNTLEDLIQTAKCSMEGIEFLNTSLCKIELGSRQLVPVIPCSTQEHEESFIGSIIPKDVTILTPIDINARGTCSKVKGRMYGVRGGSSDKKRRLGIHQKVARKCSICKKVAFHDARTCPMKHMIQE